MNAEDISVIEDWYDHLDASMRRYQIQPGDVYNSDENGFLEGQERAEKVFTQFPEQKRLFLPHFHGV